MTTTYESIDPPAPTGDASYTPMQKPEHDYEYAEPENDYEVAP